MASNSNPDQVFLRLLDEYKRFPKEFFKKADGLDSDRLERIDREGFKLVSEPVKNSRYSQFNVSYLNLIKLEKKVEGELQQMSSKLSETPLSNFKARGDLELKQAALRDRLNQVKFALFMASVNANLSIEESLKTVPQDRKDKRDADRLVANRPKLPGVWGGSADERLNQSAREKLNLTPVDPEFYETQLGKKLEADLGGRARYWSYDYGSDDLYIKVGDGKSDEVGKVAVVQNADGIRFVRTRVGPGFVEPRNADMKVDMLTAKGRFLTGNKEEETLFGSNPAMQKEKVIDEKPGVRVDKEHTHDHGPGSNKSK
jgi:hypothetical protein